MYLTRFPEPLIDICLSTGTGIITTYHYYVASEGSQLQQAKEVGELTAAEVKRAEERREQVRTELEEKRKALDARWRAYEGLEGGTFDGGKVC